MDKDRLAKDAAGKNRRYPFGLPRDGQRQLSLDSAFLFSAETTKAAPASSWPTRRRTRASETRTFRETAYRISPPRTSWSPSARICFYTVTSPPHALVPRPRKSRTPRANKVLFMDVRHIYRQLDRAHRDWTEAQNRISGQHRFAFIATKHLDFTLGGEEVRAKISERFQEAIQNLKSKIQEGKDVPGLCKVATLKENRSYRGWSLNPGRYVGVMPGGERQGRGLQGTTGRNSMRNSKALNFEAH